MRPWQAAVPAEDREIFDRGGFGQRQEWGRHPAVIVVDVCASFLGPRRPTIEAVSTIATSCGQVGWETLPAIRRLLDTARAAKIPVVYTTPTPTTKTTKKPSNHGEEGLRIPAEVAPQPGELVVRKPKASGFLDTDLAGYLRELGVDSLIVCGVSTSGCVRATAVDGFSHEFTVFVVEDCCFDRSQFFHNASLYDMNAKYSTVVILDEAVAFLTARAREAA
jgi:nicotinamidase-related amidase